MQNAVSTTGIAPIIAADYAPSAPASANRWAAYPGRFFKWCADQEEKRLLWLALTYLGLIGLALPCTLSAIVFLSGNNFSLWVLACAVNVPILAINLAAQPTKITLPALFFAWLVDFAILVYCLAFSLMYS